MHASRSMLVSSVLFALAACAGSDGRSADVTSPRTPTGVTTPTPAPLPVANAGLSGKALIYDDFVKYSNTAALQSSISTVAGGKGSHNTALYKDGYNASLAELDKSVLYNGHATLKYNQPGGTSKTPALWVYFPNGKKLTKMWARAKIRYSAGFTTKGVSRNTANSHKILGWAWDGADGRATLEITNTNQYIFDWSVSGAKSGPYVSKSGPSVTNEWTDGQWYDYIISYEQTSSTTVRERWWLARDGQKPVLKADITGTMRSGAVPGVNRFMLGLNFNQVRAANQNQALWIGQWEVVDGSTNADPFGIQGGTVTPPPTKPADPPTKPPVDTTPTKPPVVDTPTKPVEPPPTKPVDPTPPPPVDPAPTNPGQAGLSGKALVYDDFRSYSGTAALQANISTVAGGKGAPSSSLYKDGYYANLAEIDKTVLYNGHQTVKYNQPGGVSATPALWVSFPNGARLTKMWFRVKVRYSSGFTTNGVTTNSAKAYKLLGWGWSGADGRATLEISNTNQYIFDWSVIGSSSGPYASKSGPNIVSEWTDGQWYDYIISYEQTSSTTVRQRWWLARDGQKPVLKADITGTMRSGSVPTVNRVMIGLNFNQVRAANQNQALWIGQWEVVDGSQHSNPFGI